jgi:K+ transporter
MVERGDVFLEALGVFRADRAEAPYADMGYFGRAPIRLDRICRLAILNRG